MWILTVVWQDKRRTYTLDDAMEVIQLVTQHITNSGLVKMKLRWEP